MPLQSSEAHQRTNNDSASATNTTKHPLHSTSAHDGGNGGGVQSQHGLAAAINTGGSGGLAEKQSKDRRSQKAVSTFCTICGKQCANVDDLWDHINNCDYLGE